MSPDTTQAVLVALNVLQVATLVALLAWVRHGCAAINASISDVANRPPNDTAQ